MRALPTAALLIAALAAAPAAAKAPAPASPKASVTAASVVASNLKVTIVVVLKAQSAGCKGTVKASTRLSKKTARKFSGTLKLKNGTCSATLKATLPKALLGTSKAFTFSFAGNKATKKFSVSKTLKLVPPPTVVNPAPTGPGTTSTDAPPATTTPTTSTPAPSPFFDQALKGKWGTDSPTQGPNNQWVVTVGADGAVSFASFGSTKWRCGAEDELVNVNWNLLYQGTGSFVAPSKAQDTATKVSGGTNVTVSWTLDFTGSAGSGTGSGTMTFGGTFDYGSGAGGVRNCSASNAFTFYRAGI